MKTYLKDSSSSREDKRIKLDPNERPVKGVILALCCHHCCSWPQYVGRPFLQNLGFTAVIAYDYYFPIFAGVNFYLVIAICTPILTLTPTFMFAFFRYFGGHWLLNWHLKKTSRYLDFCRMPGEYTASLLP